MPMNREHGLTLEWTGNDGWLISHGTHLIGIDLDLRHEMRIDPPAVSAEQIAQELEYLFVTHDHGDHFNLPTCNDLARYGPTSTWRGRFDQSVELYDLSRKPISKARQYSWAISAHAGAFFVSSVYPSGTEDIYTSTRCEIVNRLNASKK